MKIVLNKGVRIYKIYFPVNSLKMTLKNYFIKVIILEIYWILIKKNIQILMAILVILNQKLIYYIQIHFSNYYNILQILYFQKDKEFSLIWINKFMDYQKLNNIKGLNCLQIQKFEFSSNVNKIFLFKLVRK